MSDQKKTLEKKLHTMLYIGLGAICIILSACASSPKPLPNYGPVKPAPLDKPAPGSYDPCSQWEIENEANGC